MRRGKPPVGVGEITGYAQDVFEVACQYWLNEKRHDALRSRAEAAQQEASAERRVRLKKMTAESERLHEIDAQIDLLLTLPPSEENYVKPLIDRLRHARGRVVRSRNGC